MKTGFEGLSMSIQMVESFLDTTGATTDTDNIERFLTESIPVQSVSCQTCTTIVRNIGTETEQDTDGRTRRHRRNSRKAGYHPSTSSTTVSFADIISTISTPSTPKGENISVHVSTRDFNNYTSIDETSKNTVSNNYDDQ